MVEFDALSADEAVEGDEDAKKSLLTALMELEVEEEDMAAVIGEGGFSTSSLD